MANKKLFIPPQTWVQILTVDPHCIAQASVLLSLGASEDLSLVMVRIQRDPLWGRESDGVGEDTPVHGGVGRFTSISCPVALGTVVV